MTHKIIVLWGHPRSLSTAFERMIMERGDFQVFHEPFAYVYYVLEQRACATGMIIDPDKPIEYATIREHLLKSAETSPVFVKDMTYHSYDHLIKDDQFLSRIVNTFIIRNPAKSIPSYYALDHNIVKEEIGYEEQFYIFQRVYDLNGKPPIVIDADDLQNNPAGIIAAYCQALNITFIQESLNWEKSYKKKWDVWKVWHNDVANSTGIHKGNHQVYPDTVDNNAKIKALYDYHIPFYDKMYQHRLGT